MYDAAVLLALWSVGVQVGDSRSVRVRAVVAVLVAAGTFTLGFTP